LKELLISDAMHFIRDYIGLRSLQYSADSTFMQRLFGLVGLLVFPVSWEAVSEPALKTVLLLYGERGDLPAVRAIYFPVLCR
jgi:hypothetical protein